MTIDTSGTVSDVSAMLVARITRRRAAGARAASWASLSIEPYSDNRSTP